MKFWKQQIVSTGQSPPLIVDIVLDVSGMTAGQRLMLRTDSGAQSVSDALIGTDAAGRPFRKTQILLETWQLTLSHHIPSQTPELPVVYKKSIVFFRSLYSLLRLIPAFKLHRKLQRLRMAGCDMTYRLSTSRTPQPAEAGLSELHRENDMHSGLRESSYGGIETPLGVFTLHGTFRLECDFYVEDTESALSRLGSHRMLIDGAEEETQRVSIVSHQQDTSCFNSLPTRILGRRSSQTASGGQDDFSHRHTPISNEENTPFTPHSDKGSLLKKHMNHLQGESPPFSVRGSNIATASISLGYPAIPTSSPPFSTNKTADFQSERRDDSKQASQSLQLTRQLSTSSHRSRAALELIRKPSYTFSTTSGPFELNQSSHTGPSSQLFTPTSSFTHPALTISKFSPPPLTLLMSLEKQQSIHPPYASGLTRELAGNVSGRSAEPDLAVSEVSSGSILQASVSSTAVVERRKQTNDALSKFKKLNETNALFSNSLVNFTLGSNATESATEESTMGTDQQRASVSLPRNSLLTSYLLQQQQKQLNKTDSTQPTNQIIVDNTNSATERHDTDTVLNQDGNRFGVSRNDGITRFYLSSSETPASTSISPVQLAPANAGSATLTTNTHTPTSVRHEEDDDLLFNMSELFIKSPQ